MPRRSVKGGVYDLGGEAVELWLRSGTGGECEGGGPEGRLTRMVIGGDSSFWSDVVAMLLHESIEFTQLRMDLQYAPMVDWSREMSGRLIVMTHNQHSEVCARAGEFICECLPAFGRAWKAWKKKGY